MHRAVGQVRWTLKNCNLCVWQKISLQNPTRYAQLLELNNLHTVSVFLCYDCHAYKSQSFVDFRIRRKETWYKDKFHFEERTTLHISHVLIPWDMFCIWAFEASSLTKKKRELSAT